MSAEIFEVEGVTVKLVAGGGGVFEVRKGGEVIWKKERSGHFPEGGEIMALLIGGQVGE